MLDREKPDGVIVCPTFDQVFPVAKGHGSAADCGVAGKTDRNVAGRIRRAVPAGGGISGPQMVGLNRRHYSVVNRAVADAGGPATARAVLIDWSEDPAHLRRKGFTDEQISRWVFSNSIHGLDLMTHLAGSVDGPQILATPGDGPLDWYMSLSGVSERGALVNFRSSWGSPGRWRVNLCTPGRRYVFAPLETCEVWERGAAEPRAILPDAFDARFKPGFYAQAQLFLETIDNGQPPVGNDLESARPAMTLAEQLTASCLAGATRVTSGHR